MMEVLSTYTTLSILFQFPRATDDSIVMDILGVLDKAAV